MTEPRFIAFVGREATAARIEDDLDCDPRDHRLIIVRSDRDARRLYGYRGDDVLWIDMGATSEQGAIGRARGFRVGTIEEAKALIAEWRSRADLNRKPDL